jgi:hypothetical protein
MLTKPKTFELQSFTDFAVTDKGLHYWHKQSWTTGRASRAAARDAKMSLE